MELIRKQGENINNKANESYLKKTLLNIRYNFFTTYHFVCIKIISMFTTTVVWKYFKNIWKHRLRKWKHEAGRLVQLRYVRVQIMIICQQLNDIVHVQVWGTYCCIHKCMIELLWVAEKKSRTLFSVKWFASTCLNFTTHKCMVNRMFNAIHEQSPACLKCPDMHKFAHIECQC